MKQVIYIIALLTLMSCSTVSVPLEIKSILEKNCNSCHGWNNFTKIKSGEKDNWEKILQKMIRKGAKLKNEEYKKLLDYFIKD